MVPRMIHSVASAYYTMGPYKSGYVTCDANNLPYGSHWACKKQEQIGTIITNAENKVIFPHNYKNTSFMLQSYYRNSSKVIYHLSPQTVDGEKSSEFGTTRIIEISTTMIMLVVRVLMCMLCTTNFTGDISFDACARLYNKRSRDLPRIHFLLFSFIVCSHAYITPHTF